MAVALVLVAVSFAIAQAEASSSVAVTTYQSTTGVQTGTVVGTVTASGPGSVASYSAGIDESQSINGGPVTTYSNGTHNTVTGK